MHRVSVVLAALDGALHIDEQLRSIASQTMPPCELIVGDDGSTDGTPEKVEQFASTAPFPVSLIRRPTRLGYSENFLRSARTATGDLIAFCDQDDVWLPEKLERASRAFDDAAVMLCVHDAHDVGPDLQLTKRRRPRLGILSRLNLAARLFVPHGSRSLIRTDLLSLCPPEGRPVTMYTGDDNYPQEHDEWAFFAANAVGTVRYVREPLSYFRRHASALGFGTESRLGSGPIVQLAPRDAHQLACLARGARARAAYLRMLADLDPTAQLSSRFVVEASAYVSIAALLETRRTRLDGSRGMRTLRTGGGVLRGQYRSQGHGGLGALSFCQDVRGLTMRKR